MTSDNAELAALIDTLAGGRLLVVGDVMLDRFVYGTVERVSPEAPIPVLRISRDKAMLGGAGNVLRNAGALGARVAFLSVVGDDVAGEQVRALVEDEPQAEARLLVDPVRATSIKERFVAGSQQLLRADRETIAGLSEATAEALVEAARASLEGAGAIVLSDYGKGVLCRETLAALIALGRETGVPVVVDPKGRDYAVYRGAALVTPNRRELMEATGLPAEDDAGVETACRALIERAGLDAVLATRSEQGMTLVTAGGPARHLKAEAREVFDVSGAGDTVVAVLGAALAAGIALEPAARLANVAAGIVVGKVGTAVATPGELLHSLHSSDLAAAESKVLDWDGLVHKLEQWRRHGLTVGFTNGCFDLIHPGHVSLLRQARAACDRLVVGLNSDASVKRLKGPERPVQGEAARGAVLASMAGVDAVAVFGEDTPLKLIELIRPEVLVKGADYRVDQVVGRDIVESYGGRVVLAELVPGQSTTETIRRLAAGNAG